MTRRPIRLRPYQKALEQFAAKRQLTVAKLNDWDLDDATTEIAAKLGVGKRTVIRYLNISLQARRGIQTAFESRKLTLNEADRLARQSQEIQAAVEKKLAAGVRPKAIFDKLFGKKKTSRGTLAARFTRHLTKAMESLEGQSMAKLDSLPLAGEEQTLREVSEVIRDLQKAYKYTTQRRRQALSLIHSLSSRGS